MEYRTVEVAVSAPCKVDPPAKVVPLNKQIAGPEWQALAPGAKAEAVKAQAGDHLNYEDRSDAATVGCKEVRNPPAVSTSSGTAPESLLPPSQL